MLRFKISKFIILELLEYIETFLGGKNFLKLNLLITRLNHCLPG